MTEKELIGMYLAYTIGADETMKYSDFLDACFDANIEPEVIEAKAEPYLAEYEERCFFDWAKFYAEKS